MHALTAQRLAAHCMLCRILLPRQVLAIRRGSQIYQKLWHDGLDSIFDFKSAWKTRKAQETAVEAVHVRWHAVQEEKYRKKNAKIQAYVDDDSSDDPQTEEMDGSKSSTQHERGEASMEDKQGFWDGSLRASTRCAMKSWHVLSTKIIQKSDELPMENATRQEDQSRPDYTPHWAKEPPRRVKSPGRRTVTADHQDLRRAYEKIDLLCKDRITSTRTQREVHDEHLNLSLSSVSRHQIQRSSYWSELSLQESLDLLQCADIVLEDTITDSTLADLSSHEPQSLENGGKRHESPLKRTESSKNLFLESDYRDEVEVRELSVKNALEVIVILHQHVLWKLPAVTQKTSKYWADKEKEKVFAQLQRRKSLEEQFNLGASSPLRQTLDSPERQTPSSTAGVTGEVHSSMLVRSPVPDEGFMIEAPMSLKRLQTSGRSISGDVSHEGRCVLFSDTMQSQGAGVGKAEAHGSPDSKSHAQSSNPPDMQAINELTQRAWHCRSRADEAFKIANEIDDMLNEFALRPARELAARLQSNAMVTGLASQSFRQEPSSSSKAEVLDVGTLETAELPQVMRLRESKISLRLRFPEMPLSYLSRDAFELNESIWIAALVTYSDVLRCRALSLLRRLTALRSRTKLQIALNASGSAQRDENYPMISEEDGMTGSHPDSLERRNMLQVREAATLQELEDFAVDSFRKTEFDLQLRTIEHEIVAKNKHVTQGAPEVQPHSAEASVATQSYLERILDTFTMGAWNKRLSLNPASLRLHRSALDYLLSTIPSEHNPMSSVPGQKPAVRKGRSNESMTEKERMRARGSVIAAPSLDEIDADPRKDSRACDLAHAVTDSPGQRNGKETAARLDGVDQKIEDADKETSMYVSRKHLSNKKFKATPPTSSASFGKRSFDKGSARAGRSRARFNVQEEDDRGQAQNHRWAHVTREALSTLGCLAVVLREQTNMAQIDAGALIASLEGMLKYALQAEARQGMAKDKASTEENSAAQPGRTGSFGRVLPSGQQDQDTNFVVLYIRVYCIINHILKDPARAPRLRVCGFVDIALLLLRRRNITWGLAEEIIVFLCGMTRIHGSRLLGGVSSRLLDHLHYDDFASDDDIGYADDDYEDRSIQAVTIMVEAIRMFGISPQHKKHGSQEGTANLSTAPTVIKNGETEQGGPPPGQPLEVKVKTISLRVVGEGFRFLSLLAAGEAEAMKSILEHDVLALSILALRAHKMLVQMILVATPLCLTILRADPRAMEACLRMQYHLLLVDLLGLHPDNALVIEASLTGLKVVFHYMPI